MSGEDNPTREGVKSSSRDSETIEEEVEDLRERVDELIRENERLKKQNEQLRGKDTVPAEKGEVGKDSFRSHFDRLFSSVETPAFLIDVQRDKEGMSFVYRAVNEAYRAKSGCESGRFRGMKPRELFDEQTCAYVRTQYCRCVSQKQAMVYRVGLDYEGMKGDFRTTLIPYLENNQVEVIFGVAEQLPAAREREGNRKEFRRAVEASGHGVMMTDTEGMITYVNRTFERISGYQRDELIGQTPAILKSGLHDEVFYRNLWETIQSGEVWEGEIINRRKSGEIFYAQQTIAPVENVDGELRSYIAIQEDITEQKAQERALRLFRETIERSPDSIFVVDPDTSEFIDVNKTAEEMLGYSREELLEMRVEDVNPDLKGGKTWDEFLNKLKEQGPLSIKTEHRRRDGTLYPVEVQTDHVAFDDQSRIVATARDITESERRKQTLEETREREERFRKLAENVGGMFWQYDPRESEYLYLSSHCQQVIGLSRETLYENPHAFVENVHPEDRNQVRDLADENWTEKFNETFRMEVDGDWRWVRVRAYPVEEDGQDGRVTMVAGMAEDIHDQVTRQKELEEQIEETERISELKSDYVARTTHDLRTPLNSILGMTEVLESEDLSDQQREYLQTIKSTGQMMLHITNDILDLDRVESGELELLNQPFSIRDMLDEVAMLFYPWLRDENLTLKTRVRDDVPDRLIGDPNRLKQILINLIGNAVKFTEEGLIQVNVTQEAMVSDDVRLKVDVKDTGPGISEEVQSKIFEERRSDSLTEHSIQPGAGLGLSVCRNLVELMSGDISLQSEKGAGSTFSFTVPLETTPDDGDETGRVQEPKLDEAHVLVVDDNRLLRRTLQAQLAQASVTVHGASNAEEAGEILLDPEENTDVDVVFLDRRLDDMLGTELLEQIARDEHAIDTERVYMLTGDTERMVEEELPDIDYAGVIQKPVSSEEVREAVHDVLVQQAPQQETTTGERGESFVSELRDRKLHMLLVDDDLLSNSTLEQYLTPVVEKLTRVRNGRDALDRCKETDYDVILMNMELPDMHGLDLIDELRRNESGDESNREVPIVIQTARGTDGFQEGGTDLSGTVMLEKPYRRVELYAGIKSILD